MRGSFELSEIENEEEDGLRSLVRFTTCKTSRVLEIRPLS
jgi:hypothetical protein